MRTIGLLVAVVVFAAACAKKPAPYAISRVEPALVWGQLNELSFPDQLQSRFQIKVRSKPMGLGGTTGGGLQVARPGRARLEIFGPLGGSLVSVASDGEALGVWLARDHRHLRASDAESMIRDATGGAVGMDEVLGLLVGQVPLPDEVPSFSHLDSGLVRASYVGPRGLILDLDVDPQAGTPMRLTAKEREDQVTFEVAYEGWSAFGAGQLPQKVDLTFPAVELFVSFRYASWKVPDTLLSMDTDPPTGVVSEPLLELLRAGFDALNGGEAP
jgi:outer membrane biogenesis lipoprotein LolB